MIAPPPNNVNNGDQVAKLNISLTITVDIVDIPADDGPKGKCSPKLQVCHQLF